MSVALPPGDAPVRRYLSRPRSLSADQLATIHTLAGSASLRTIAARAGCSHETVRAVLAERA